MYTTTLVIFLLIDKQCLSQMVELKPNLLDSFIPAGMQVIAHITEYMKFELKPQTGSTTTTVRPTIPHKPGIYAPQKPPGPSAFFSRSTSYEDYVERLKRPSEYYNYFDRYQARNLKFQEPSVLGKDLNDLIQLVNNVEEIKINDDLDGQALEFSRTYDDSADFRSVLLRQKKKPPTRAYVSLLSLYDMLNKEAKKLGLNKYNGYSENVLTQLAEISTGTSADQLRGVLKKIVDREDTKNAQITKRIKEMLKDLEESSSYLSAALRYIPPLGFEI